MLDYFSGPSGSVKNDTLSGLTVALALVPEAIAFAFFAGVSPLIGLYSAFFLGLLTALFGGRPGMISGATGAMAVVIVALVAQHGVEYLFPTVMLCGLTQVAIGIGRLGKLIRMVPYSVMLGFVNGLAIVIGLAQLGSFKTLADDGTLQYLSGTPLIAMVSLVLLTMAIIYFLPKLTKAVPASLVAILTVTLISVGVNRSYEAEMDGAHLIATVKDMLRDSTRAAAYAKQRGDDSNGGPIDATTNQSAANAVATPRSADIEPLSHAAVGTTLTASRDTSLIDATTGLDIPDLDLDGGPRTRPAVDLDAAADVGISGGLPRPFFMDFEMVPLSLETLWIILPYAMILCGVGLIESLMTLTLIDEITETRGRGNRECIGQGIANMVCGFFGGMGGCAMIGQSLINVNSGGRGRLSGIVAAVSLLIFVLFLAPLIEQISMAALVGVMFMVVVGTFEWASLKMFGRMPLSDVLVMILVAGYTVFMHDLATAVILGVIVSALVFAWKHATHIFADVKINETGSKTYQLHGPLFFASVQKFKTLFDVAEDPEDVVIDFYFTRVYDQSGLEAINAMAEKYEAAGKRLHLTHLSDECRSLLDRAGELVEVNLSEDPQYHVATDRLG